MGSTLKVQRSRGKVQRLAFGGAQELRAWSREKANELNLDFRRKRPVLTVPIER
jgi:hypothetical protein